MAAYQNGVNNTLYNGIVQTGKTAGNIAVFNAYDTTGSSYTTFATLTAGLVPTFDLNTLTTIDSAYIYRAGGTDVAIVDGGTGLSTTPTDGQLLIGTTATNNYTLATLTEGAGVSITNGSGTITIAATPQTMVWSNKGANFGLVANNAYTVNGASQWTATLPATAALGDTFRILARGALGYIIAANTGQTIYFGNQSTTITTGTIASSTMGDCLEIACINADTDFMVMSSEGNFLIS